MPQKYNRNTNNPNKPQKISKSKQQSNPQEKEPNPLRTLFEKMRPNAVPQDQRYKYMGQALEIMEGKLTTLVNSPVQARIIELICKKGSQEQRQKIFLELKDNLVNMLSSKYSRFTAVELLTGGKLPEAKEIIEQEVIPQAAKLMKNAISNISLNAVFSDSSNEVRNKIVNQIMMRQADPDVLFIEKQLKENPSLIQIVISNVRRPLEVAEGKMLLGSIVCIHVLLKCFKVLFFLQAQGLTNQSSQLRELLGFLENVEVEQLGQLIDTREGAELGAYIYTLQGPKAKKHIMQTFRPRMAAIWTSDKHAATFLISTVFQTDDVVMVRQNVVESLSKVHATLIQDNVFLFAFPMLMVSQFIRVVQGDGHCRKCVSEGLLKIIQNQETITQCKKSPQKRQIQLAAIISQFLDQKGAFSSGSILTALQAKNNCMIELLEEILNVQQSEDPECQKAFDDIKGVKQNIAKVLASYKQSPPPGLDEKQEKRLQRVIELINTVQ